MHNEFKLDDDNGWGTHLARDNPAITGWVYRLLGFEVKIQVRGLLIGYLPIFDQIGGKTL